MEDETQPNFIDRLREQLDREQDIVEKFAKLLLSPKPDSNRLKSMSVTRGFFLDEGFTKHWDKLKPLLGRILSYQVSGRFILLLRKDNSHVVGKIEVTVNSNGLVSELKLTLNASENLEELTRPRKSSEA